MAMVSLFIHVFLLLFCCKSPFCSSASTNEGLPTPVRAGYWPSFAADFAPMDAVNSSLLTHLLYAFAGINTTSFHVEADNATEMTSFTPTVRARNPHVQTLLSIGGGGANATVFSVAMASSASRQAFIQSSIALARGNGFNGLNIDWEYPSSEADMNSFGVLLSELRTAVSIEANTTSSSPLLLTAAVYYAPVVLSSQSSYPVASMVQNLDLVHIMAFDYHGAWENVTGEHTALSQPSSNFTTYFGLSQWTVHGLPPDKAIVGLAAYGHSWTLDNVVTTGVGALALGPGPAQSTSQDPGIFYYFEIEKFIASQHATVVIDNVTSSAYCFHGDAWIGYDNPQTVATKLAAFQKLGYRGYFFWAISYDDPKTWALSTAASSAWESSTTSSDSSPSILGMWWLAWLICPFLLYK